MKRTVKLPPSVGKYIIDDAGNVIPEHDVLKWGEWCNTADRRVSETFVGTTRVSTVFMAFSRGEVNGKPILWETMVFGGPCDGNFDRYASKDLAIRGHQNMVELVRENQPAPAQGIFGVIAQFKQALEQRLGKKYENRRKR